MVNKMREATHKLKNIKIIAPTAHSPCNAHMINKVCFGCEILLLAEHQEKVLKSTHELVLL